MSSIELPDPVIIWETEVTRDLKNNLTETYTVRATVGSVVIFERMYQDNDNSYWDGFAYDLADAKEKAAQALGERLSQLLMEDE